MATSRKTFRPEELASKLGISGKIVRAHLRRTYPRPANAKGSTWVLNEKQAKETLAYFAKRNPKAYARVTAKRARTVKPRTAKTTDSVAPSAPKVDATSA